MLNQILNQTNTGFLKADKIKIVWSGKKGIIPMEKLLLCHKYLTLLQTA